MAEKKKVELIKLTIQIGDSKVQVTKDEARDLYNALAEMFQVKSETVYVDRYRDWHWPWRQGYYGGSLGGLTADASNNLKGLGIASDNQKFAEFSSNSVKLLANFKDSE